jgi:hypothetical protein
MFKFNMTENFNTLKAPLPMASSYNNVEPSDTASLNMASLSGEYVKPYSMAVNSRINSGAIFANENSGCNISIIFARIILIILVIFILYYIFMKNSNIIQNIKNISTIQVFDDGY